MNPTAKTRRPQAARAVAAVLAVAASGCGQAAQDTAPAGYRDPGQVCGGFAAARAGHDTTRDAGPEDAHRRARRWLHPELGDDPPAPGRHPQWALWRAHRVVVEVSVAPWAGDALPGDTDQLAYRAVLVSTTPAGADGWTGDTTWHTVYCTLGRAGEGWLITDYQLDGGG